MSTLQPLFRRFHEAIQLKRFGENAELREKRDRILNRLRDNKPPCTFEWFNQGSYEMGTGIKPLDGDYDIDIGLVFNTHYTEHDPVEVKRWVYNAVQSHTARVEWRRPCITVYYHERGEPVYHVDLAIFAKDPYKHQVRLAIGKEHSAREQRAWQPDDRKGFMEAIKNRFSGDDGFQFRRVIRYLKRWKDEHFPSHGHAAPSGLALTVAAYHWFQPARQGWYADYDDLEATCRLVAAIKDRSNSIWGVGRLSLQFPYAPHDDVFERMSDQQMQEFHQRVETLYGWLDEARRTQSSAPLCRAFGRDFPEQ